LQDRGDINELVSKEDYEEILNRKIQQMKKKNEELLQKHLVCSSGYIV